MEIIKTLSKELKCIQRDTLLRINNADLIERQDQASWFTHGRFFVCCPVCRNIINFYERIKEGGEK